MTKYIIIRIIILVGYKHNMPVQSEYLNCIRDFITQCTICSRIMAFPYIFMSLTP